MHAQAGTYTVTLEAYGTQQDLDVTSQSLVVKAYDVIAHSFIKILGNYEYNSLKSDVITPLNQYIKTRSKGVLTVTQRDPTTIMVTVPDFATPLLFPFETSSVQPAFFHYTDRRYAGQPESGYAIFYPTGDSLYIALHDHISAAANIYYDYHDRRRPQ